MTGPGGLELDNIALPLLLAFLSGSIPFTWLIGKARGIDLLSAGSGNPGATNLSRELGKFYGALGLILDLLKGAIPVLLTSGRWDQPAPLFMVGAAAVFGHCYSPFLKFRGGKGVATTGGVLLVIEPAIALLLLSGWFIGLKSLRSVGMASVTASVFGICLAAVILAGWPPLLGWLVTAISSDSQTVLGWVLLIVSVLVLIRHRSNIQQYFLPSSKEEKR
ncbi:MAG TPA: glycerol-3-phosphate 1-O-acyltransferase PlsY [Planctomycetes bacterium]|nr:glycerol-3-phosphate 1-O-acyltransferase PlsY [Planctomycetota bacterium]HIK82862.1 glycerol-3-phosphate 1-O-acyltransferase [Planctomycetota bacterium]